LTTVVQTFTGVLEVVLKQLLKSLFISKLLS
jgi:hypothetical protein